MWLPVYLCGYPSTCVAACLSACLPTWLPVYQCGYPFTCLCSCMSIVRLVPERLAQTSLYADPSKASVASTPPLATPGSSSDAYCAKCTSCCEMRPGGLNRRCLLDTVHLYFLRSTVTWQCRQTPHQYD